MRDSKSVGPVFFFGQDWDLNSGLHDWKVGTLPFEPHIQSILEMESHDLPRLAQSQSGLQAWASFNSSPIFCVRSAVSEVWSKKHSESCSKAKSKVLLLQEGAATDYSLIGRTHWVRSYLRFCFSSPHPNGWVWVHNLPDWPLFGIRTGFFFFFDTVTF
jgi:hypothetical protein